MSAFNKALGKVIRYSREQEGLTQEQLAKAIGKNATMVIAYEKGTTAIKVETLAKIARRLGLRSHVLIMMMPDRYL